MALLRVALSWSLHPGDSHRARCHLGCSAHVVMFKTLDSRRGITSILQMSEGVSER